MYRSRSMVPMLILALAWACVTTLGAEELPALTSTPPAAVNLLPNHGFEDPDAGAWSFSDWPPREETAARLIADSVRFTDEQAAEGERCLVFDLTTVGADRILIAQQRFTAETLVPHDGETLRMSAKVLVASGPTVQQLHLTMRQWGEDGLLDHHHVRLTADVNEWAEGGTEFRLRVGETTRADLKVSCRQTPDLNQSPVVYVDDVRLEVLTQPALSAELPWGEVLMAPDGVLPVGVRISQEAWEAGRRGLRWDVTGPDGMTSLARGEHVAQSREPVLSVDVPDLTEGRYAVRVALGGEPGERWREVLQPFTRAEGPLAASE